GRDGQSSLHPSKTDQVQSDFLFQGEARESSPGQRGYTASKFCCQFRHTHLRVEVKRQSHEGLSPLPMQFGPVKVSADLKCYRHLGGQSFGPPHIFLADAGSLRTIQNPEHSEDL